MFLNSFPCIFHHVFRTSTWTVKWLQSPRLPGQSLTSWRSIGMGTLMGWFPWSKQQMFIARSNDAERNEPKKIWMDDDDDLFPWETSQTFQWRRHFIKIKWIWSQGFLTLPLCESENGPILFLSDLLFNHHGWAMQITWMSQVPEIHPFNTHQFGHS